ncbi:MAG: hypothetical protein ACRDHW_07170 [Ktedonobacteraceae bacterium]
MIATDPLSLVFIFCFLLGFGFFLLTALLGSHGHGHGHAHAGGHISSHAHVGGHISSHAHVVGHAHASPQAHMHAGSHGHAPAHASGQHAGSQQHAQGQSQHTGSAFFAVLNPISAGLFLLGFGLFGYFFHNLTNVAVSLSLVLAIVGGVVLSIALLSLLSRLFSGAEGSTELDVVDRTGMLGKVSITIPEKGLGEIIYTSPGGVHKSIPARGLDSQRITRDQEVVVVNYENGVAEVDTWEHFMHEEMHVSHATTSDDLAQLRALLDAPRSSEMEMEMVMRQEPQKE